MVSRAPEWDGNSCPNEDSELQNEATLTHFHKACMQEAGRRGGTVIIIIADTYFAVIIC